MTTFGQNDNINNMWHSQWQKFKQNGDIFVSILPLVFMVSYYSMLDANNFQGWF